MTDRPGPPDLPDPSDRPGAPDLPGSPDLPAPRDFPGSPGLQVQRTELSWRRTMLSFWAAALIVAKVTFPIGVAALAGPIAVTAIGRLRHRSLRERRALRRRHGLALALMCMITALAGAIGAAHIG